MSASFTRSDGPATVGTCHWSAPWLTKFACALSCAWAMMRAQSMREKEARGVAGNFPLDSEVLVRVDIDARGVTGSDLSDGR